MLRWNYVLNGNKETSQFKIINNPDPVKGFESQYFQICLYKISAEKKDKKNSKYTKILEIKRYLLRWHGSWNNEWFLN